MTNAAERRADTALAKGDRAGYHSERQQAHDLRGAASKEYNAAGVRLTPVGQPFAPDVRDLR